jgi:HD-GYP domain-containing protein (c-di-GMP phosphodiesterase class II)
MRLISVDMCPPGVRLAKNIYNEEGMVLLGEHIELTQTLLNKLKKNGIDYIYIEDPRTDDILVRDTISDDTRRVAMEKIRQNFKRFMENAGRKNGGCYYFAKDFQGVMHMILDDLSRQENAMIMLANMSIVDHYLYQHSLNVCIYATILGISSGYSRDELMTLGLGALLHDIGKTQIPMEILQKPGKLTEEEMEVVRTHAELGFKILKDEPNIPLISAHCAYQHHERWNGSGYPRQLKGEEIHEFARWISLVDVYDALTNKRAYRNPLLPHQAIEVLYGGTGTLFEKDKIEKFRDKIVLYPLGGTVTLNTGEVGVVVDINSSSLHRPIVRVLQNEKGEELKVPYEIDLSKKLSVMITRVGDIKVERPM